jgi:cytochrome P450
MELGRYPAVLGHLREELDARASLPFGGGHRRCPGAHLSDYEMRIALAMIVTRWEFEIVGEDKEIRHNIGTGPKRGVRTRVAGGRSLTVWRPTMLH